MPLISDLELIGYGPVSTYMLPTILTPVFRFKTAPELILVPPLSISSTHVYGAHIIDINELNSFLLQRNINLVAAPIKAKSDFSLWMDIRGYISYEEYEVVREKLDKLAQQYLANAINFLHTGEIADADRWASRAMSANGELVEPYAIKAAIRRREKREEAVAVIKKCAKDLCTSEEVFESFISYFMNEIPK